MASKIKKIKLRIERIYWFVPLILIALQALYTFNSMNQIRYEELAESVRNPYWISQGYLYDGISGSVAWYGIQATIYNILGFSLHTAKFLRLLLSLISLFCLAAILKRYLSLNLAIIVLLTIGLSPTVLYFNILQTTYGMDLQYLPICLFLLLSINFKRKGQSVVMQLLFGLTAMIAWLSYPTFIFYLVPLGIFYFFSLLKNQKNISLVFKNSIITLFGFLLPLLLTFLYIKNREWLINDPNTQSGLFRGAGRIELDFSLFLRNLEYLLVNLFQNSFGYNFEVSQVDFSGWIPIISVLFILFVSFLMVVKNQNRFFVSLILITLILNLIFGGFSLDSAPGIRRFTPILASIYGLFIFAWVFVLKQEKNTIKYILMGMLITVSMHHLVVYTINLSYISKPSLYRDTQWFAQAETPQKSLNLFLERVQQDELTLACVDQKKQFIECRYSEIYAAIAGSCLWNRLYCHQIKAYDTKLKKFVPLSIDLWNNYQFSH